MFAIFGGVSLYVAFGFIAYAILGSTWTYAVCYIAVVFVPIAVGNAMGFMMSIRLDQLVNKMLVAVGINWKFNL